MKKTIFLATILATVLALVSCEKSEVAPSTTQNVAPNKGEATHSLTLTNASKVTAATPSLSSVTGTLGYSANTNNSYPTYLRSEKDSSSVLTITGANLGSSQGTATVYFEKYSNNQWSAPSSYVISKVTWGTGSTIKVNLASNLSSLPIAEARFRVVINNVSYNTKTFAVVPFIDGRQYEQCTWWVSKRTREQLLPPSNALYANVNSIINADYVPTANDILSWRTNVHEAFIESVAVTPATTANGNVTTYVLTITEANVPWSGNSNSTAPMTYSTTIKVKKTNGVNAFVSGYGTYRSTKISGASYYKAQ